MLDHPVVLLPLPHRRSVVAVCCFSAGAPPSAPDTIGAAAFVLLSKLIVLMKASSRPPLASLGFHRFAFESFLQVLLDIKHACFVSKQIRLGRAAASSRSPSHMGMPWEVVSIGLKAICPVILDHGVTPTAQQPLGSATTPAQLSTTPASAALSGSKVRYWRIL